MGRASLDMTPLWPPRSLFCSCVVGEASTLGTRNMWSVQGPASSLNCPPTPVLEFWPLENESPFALPWGAPLPPASCPRAWPPDLSPLLCSLVCSSSPGRCCHLQNWEVQYSRDVPLPPRQDLNAPGLYIPSESLTWAGGGGGGQGSCPGDPSSVSALVFC